MKPCTLLLLVVALSSPLHAQTLADVARSLKAAGAAKTVYTDADVAPAQVLAPGEHNWPAELWAAELPWWAARKETTAASAAVRASTAWTPADHTLAELTAVGARARVAYANEERLLKAVIRVATAAEAAGVKLIIQDSAAAPTNKE